MRKRILSCLLVLAMMLSLLPVNVFAKLDTGHKIDVTFTVLYVGDEFRIGYSYGASEKTQFVCQYTTNHSDTAYTNHTIAISDIKAAADRATVNTGYQIVGWSKESGADPKIWGFDLGSTKDTACNKGTTIYLVAKDPTPKTEYSLTYMENAGTDTVTNMPAKATYTGKETSYDFTVDKPVPVREGYDFQGWGITADAKDGLKKAGDKVTATKDDPNQKLYAIWKEHVHHDDNEDGFCDDDNACLHPKDDDGNCTIPGCTHPDTCCPKPEDPNPDPTEPTTKPSLSDVSVRVQCADESKVAVHGASEFGLPDFLAVSKSDPQYKDNGMVKHEDGSYTYSITLLPSNFLSMYNNTKLGADKTPRGLHFIVGQTGSTTIEWKWDGKAWVCQTASVEGKGYSANVKLVYDVKSPDVAPTGFNDVSVVVRDQSEKHTSIVFGAPWVPNASHYASTGYEKNADGDLIYTAVINPQRFVDKYNNTPGIGQHKLVSYTGTKLQWRWGETGWEPISEDITGEAKTVKIAIDVRCLLDVNVYVTPAYDGEPLVSLNADTLKRVGLPESYVTYYDDYEGLLLGKFASRSAALLDAGEYMSGYEEDEDAIQAAVTEMREALTNSIKDKDIWTLLYVASGTDDDVESILNGTLAFYAVSYEVGGENVTGMPTPNYPDDSKTGVYDYYLDGETVTLPTEKPVRTGYTFEGWKYGDKTYSAGETITVDGEDVTFTAQWQIIPPAADSKPSYTGLKVLVECIDNQSGHEEAGQYYGLVYGLNNTDGFKEIGQDQIDGDYYYTVEVNKDFYIDKYSNTTKTAHTEAGESVAPELLWKWNGLNWVLVNEKDDQGGVLTIGVKCEPKQVVNVVIYRNGNFETPYKTVELDKQSKGTVIDLGKLNISDYYTPNATGKYEFYGWYNDGTWNSYKKDPANVPDGLKTVTVNGWTNIIAMVYDYEKVAVKAVYDNDKAGAKDIFVGEALHGSPLQAYLESSNIALNQPGYTHTEWYNWDWYAWEDHAVGANATVEGWTNVYVAYKAIPYGVTYSYHNSVPDEVMDTLPTDDGTYTVKDQVTVQIPTVKEVAVDGYKWTFKGWQLAGKDVKSEQVNMTVGGLHFEGIWERETLPAAEYPVTYEYVSGTEGAALPWNVIASLPVNKYTYAEGEKVPTAMKPDDMVFGEYTWKFHCWTLDGTAVAPNTQVPMVKGGLHFVGTWIRTSAQDEEYPVTYSYVSGVEGVELPEEVKATLPTNEYTYMIGQQVPTAAKPADVTVDGYIWSLKAWKLGDNEIVPNNSVPMVEGGLNFVGIWTREKATVTVTFDANGGDKLTDETTTITKGGMLDTLPTPTRSGYSFDGWFTAADGGTQIKANETTFGTDTTIYAHWTKKSSGGSSSRDYDYTLRYVTNGGKAIASETKSKSWTKAYEDLPMPTRAGYRFDGWYYDSALKKEVTGDVKVNSSNVTLYAGWTGSSVPDSLNGEDHFAYVQGYADGTVRPNTPVTRAQVATILFRLLDESVRKEYLTESNTFTDVAANYWANTAISTMANMGVFKGRTADRFDPNAPITRGEFAAVCARFDDSKVKTTETYSDIDGYWAASEILRAAALGWVQGYQDGSYRPNNSITRAQVVTMINRVLCRMPEENADLLKGMTSFTDCAEGDWCYLAIQEATNSHDYKTKSGSIHEKWTDLNTAPDWSKFEH